MLHELDQLVILFCLYISWLRSASYNISDVYDWIYSSSMWWIESLRCRCCKKSITMAILGGGQYHLVASLTNGHHYKKKWTILFLYRISQASQSTLKQSFATKGFIAIQELLSSIRDPFPGRTWRLSDGSRLNLNYSDWLLFYLASVTSGQLHLRVRWHK